jgi:hypothetical protein
MNLITIMPGSRKKMMIIGIFSKKGKLNNNTIYLDLLPWFRLLRQIIFRW